MAFVVAATWQAKPGEEQRVRKALVRAAERSRKEAGNLLYQPHTDPETPGRFFIYERYRDAAAFEAHKSSNHFETHVLKEAVPYLAAREVAFWETFDE